MITQKFLINRFGERGAYIAKSFTASFAARIFGLIFSILITPMMLDYLGNENYGLWTVLISFSGFLAFSDFGLSAGLLNFILKYKNEMDKVEKAISSTFWFLTVTSVSLIILLISGSYFLDWGSFFNTNINNVNSLVRIVILLFLINIPFSIIQKIQFGFLQNHIYHLWEVVQKITLILFIIIGIQLQLNLFALIIGYYLIFILINLSNLLIYGSKNKHIQLNKIILNKLQIDQPIFNQIFKTGFLFLLMNLTYVLGRSSNKLIISYWGSLENVTEYDILLKPFEIFMVFIMMFTGTLWSAFGDALQKKDFMWIQKIIKKSFLFIAIGVLIITTVMIFYGNNILEIWLGNKYDFNANYYLVLGIWTLILALSNVFSALLNAGNYLKFQIVTFLIYGIISFFCKIYGLIHFGLFGFIMLNTITYFLIILIPDIIKYKKIKHEIY